ncbi:hypothetical protein NFJ02_33g83140 [Pycnococcus provasolii]
MPEERTHTSNISSSLVEEKPLGSFFKNMSYEIVTLDEMIWDGEKQHFFYECPCGDVFTLTPDDNSAYEVNPILHRNGTNRKRL